MAAITALRTVRPVQAVKYSDVPPLQLFNDVPRKASSRNKTSTILHFSLGSRTYCTFLDLRRMFGEFSGVHRSSVREGRSALEPGGGRGLMGRNTKHSIGPSNLK